MTAAAHDIGRAIWLEERRKGIGGSDASAILGLSPFASPIDVWLDKRSQAPEREETEPMWWGRELEDIIARRYMEQTGTKVWNPRRVIAHPEHDWMIGTPDRLAIGKPLGLEVKTASHFAARDWGDPGTDQVPEAYVVQCLHYMAITGFDRWDLAVLIGGSDFRVYTIRRDTDVEDAITQRLREWWERHIVQGERPEIDGSDGTRQFLASIFPADRLPLAAAPPEAEGLAAELAEARAAQKYAEELRATCENRMKALIGEHAGFDGSDWRVTWKSVRGRTSVNWECVARALLVGWKRDRLDLPDITFEQLIEEHTKTGEGYRRFLFTRKGD